MARLTLLLATMLLCCAAPAEARKVPPGWLGVTVGGLEVDHDEAEWDRIAGSGAETVRTAFLWAFLQPHPPGAEGATYDFSSTDAIVLSAARRRLTVLPVLQWAPDWAVVPPAIFASPPANTEALQAVFTALVGRYGPNGSLWREHPEVPRTPIRTWQVFNEPNLTLFWSVQPFEASYVIALKAAERGIHAADPRAKVVLAGLPNQSWKALEAIYTAGGRGSFDAVAIHPYARTPADVMKVLRYARRVMRTHGDRRLPIWITEFTWPAMAKPAASAVGVFGGPYTEVQQAKLLNETLRRFVAARKRLHIGRVLWYSWLSHPTSGSTDPFDFSGLRRIAGDARRDTPALRVYRRWARRLAR